MQIWIGINTVVIPREDWDAWDPTLISEVSNYLNKDDNIHK